MNISLCCVQHRHERINSSDCVVFIFLVQTYEMHCVRVCVCVLCGCAKVV